MALLPQKCRTFLNTFRARRIRLPIRRRNPRLAPHRLPAVMALLRPGHDWSAAVRASVPASRFLEPLCHPARTDHVVVRPKIDTVLVEIRLGEFFVLLALTTLAFRTVETEIETLLAKATDKLAVPAPAVRCQRAATVTPDLLRRTIEMVRQPLTIRRVIPLGPVNSARPAIQPAPPDQLACL